jgi:hypothetical protein
MLNLIKVLFLIITLVTIILNLVSFILTILLLTNTHAFSVFVTDLKSNVSMSPLFDIFVSDTNCIQESNGYLLGYFEGTESGCDCR